MYMKTIITTLPIYDKVAKQCFERAKHSGHTTPRAIISPLERLPSFQWLDGTDGSTTVTKIELIGQDGTATDITASHFTTCPLPASHAITGDVYFQYKGTNLDSDLPCGLYYLKITMNNAKIYYSEWIDIRDVYDQTTYSSNYLILTFSHSCDFGDILYHDGFTQKAWIEAETMEPSFPLKEEGQENGEGRFVRTFGRQVKKYLVKTSDIPDYMVDVFHRMRLHDTVSLLNLVGDSNSVYNLEVEHEWLFDDKYYAKAELTFDYNEAVTVMGCCVNIA
jgi:hypothetical protein